MSESVAGLFNAGQFKLHRAEYAQVNGITLDVYNQIDSFTIYQDLYSPFITARINFKDTQDLPNFFGRSTADMFVIELETPGLEYGDHPEYGKINIIRHHFLIYKMGDRFLSADRQQRFSVNLISYSNLYDSLIQISKKFRGPVNELAFNQLKMLQDASGLQKTPAVGQRYNKTDYNLGNVEFVSNFWSPIKLLNYLREHAIDNSEPGSPFFLYENFDGFSFRSLRDLISAKKHHYFTTDDYTADVVTEGATEMIGRVTRNPMIDYTVVQEMRVDVNFDTMNLLMSGGLQSKLITFDPITKQYQTRLYSANELTGREKLNSNEFVKSDLVEMFRKLAGKDTSNIMLMHKTYGLFDQNSTKSSDGVVARFADSMTDHNNIQRRVMLSRLFAHKVEIDVFGRLDYKVGDRVYLNCNQTQHITKGESLDDYASTMYSGYYIVTAIVHKFDRVAHNCTIELSKESTRQV